MMQDLASVWERTILLLLIWLQNFEYLMTAGMFAVSCSYSLDDIFFCYVKTQQPYVMKSYITIVGEFKFFELIYIGIVELW